MALRPFAEIEAAAARRHGGEAALAARVTNAPSRAPEAGPNAADDRILAQMTRRVFYSGFSSKVIDQKWPGFEAAFWGFAVARCAAMTEADMDALLANPAIVRNGAKIASVQQNALLLLDLAKTHGAAAKFFAEWPDDHYVGLLAFLKDKGGRLGGETGMRLLRDLGKPAFVLTGDVTKALIREGVVAKSPSSKSDMAAVQNAFNQWSRESSRDLTYLSRVLALSVE